MQFSGVFKALGIKCRFFKFYLLVYHGSENIIESPSPRGGKRTNDYGYGFYTTEHIELAKEWACSRNTDGYVNIYEADFEGLRILSLNAPEYNILNWLAILTKYRSTWQKSSISEDAKNYLQQHFFIDPSDYDVIIGYRADDSYFSFAQDFVSNTISLSKLSEAMHLGKLGEQIVFKSDLSFSHIRFIGREPAKASDYYERKKKRDRDAQRAYRSTKRSANQINELFMIDIMREGIENGDPRLR